MNIRVIAMTLIKLMFIAFIAYVAYTEGKYDQRKEIVKRAEKFNKEIYSLQDIEVIIFGETQE